MVKNELSIRAQQTENVALKLANNAIEKIKLETTKNVVSVNSKIPFKSNESEIKLQQSRKDFLKKNVDSLFAKSESTSNAIVLKNKFDYKKYEWSFVNIDRSNPDKEQIRKIISYERQAFVNRENKYLLAEFNAKWYEKEKEEHIKYHLGLDEKMQALYGENPHYEHESYNEFYKKVNDEYNSLNAAAKEKVAKLYQKVEKVIENAYLSAYAFEARQEIFEVSAKVVDMYNELSNISIELENQNVDLQVLIEQTKEKLDVYDEKEELLKAIEQNKETKAKLLADIAAEQEKLNQAYAKYAQQRNKVVNVSDHGEDEQEHDLLQQISSSFAGRSFEEAFDLTFAILKRYVGTLCPFYYSFFETKEAEYIEKSESYRKEQESSLSKDLAKAYKDQKSYIKYLSSSEAKADIEPLKQKHTVLLADAKEEYKARVAKLSKDRAQRIAEYKEEKANAKVTLKLADAVKAAEVKEVVKLYKKAINQGELKRRIGAFNTYIKNILKEHRRYSKEVLNETLPETLIYVLEYENLSKALAKEKSKEYSKLKAELNKEHRLSKYKKNSTSAKRENALGYLFLSIWGVGFLILTLIPIVYITFMCFNRVTYNATSDGTGYSPMLSLTGDKLFPSWVGFDNFETLFLSNYNFAFELLPQFARSLLFFLPIVVFIAFVLAMLLNTKIKGRTFFRVIYFLPVVIVSGPVLSMLDQANTSGTSSIRLSLDGSSVAKILESISPKALEIANEVFSNFVIILWMTGVPIVLFISALQKINKQLYEAAEIDGANKWQSLWTITFPLIKSVLMIVCLFTIMQITTINVSFVNPITSWLDEKIEENNANLGVVAVAAWAQTIIVLIFVIVSFLLFREKEFISKDKNYEEMEELKRIKQQRKAKIYAFFHVNDIKAFLTKLFAPISKFIHARKAKKKEKEEMGGM